MCLSIAIIATLLKGAESLGIRTDVIIFRDTVLQQAKALWAIRNHDPPLK